MIRAKYRSLIDAGKVQMEDFPQKLLQILSATWGVEILYAGSLATREIIKFNLI